MPYRKEGEWSVKYERWCLPAAPEHAVEALMDAGYP